MVSMTKDMKSWKRSEKKFELEVPLHEQTIYGACLAASVKMVNDYYGLDSGPVVDRCVDGLKGLFPEITLEWLEKYCEDTGVNAVELAMTRVLGGIIGDGMSTITAAKEAIKLFDYDVTLASTNPLFEKGWEELLKECNNPTRYWGYFDFEMKDLKEYLELGGKVERHQPSIGWLKKAIGGRKVPVIAVSPILKHSYFHGEYVVGPHAYVVDGFDDSRIFVKDPIAGKMKVPEDYFLDVWGDPYYDREGRHSGYSIVLEKRSVPKKS